MMASSTGPRRESASATHSNGRPSMLPLDDRRLFERALAKILGLSCFPSTRPQPGLDQQGQPLLLAHPSTIGDFLPSKTSSRITSQRTASPYICAIGRASGSSSDATFN